MWAGLAAILAGHVAELTKLRAYAAALYACAAVLVLFALAFALVGVRFWLLRYGVEYPDLWIALGLVIVAAPFAGFGLHMQRRRPRTRPATEIALVAGPPAVRFAARQIDARVIAIGAVLLAGVVVGRRLTR
jgi:hypothetical protein